MEVSEVTQAMSEGLARRLSRRGVFGTVGRVAIATLGGGLIAESLLSQPAAASASCSTNESIPCDCLTGNNSCPSGSTLGGCWVACVSGLCGGTHAAKFCDCCGGCSGLGCTTKTNCHSWNTGRCSCCFNAAAGAYCSDNHYSKCRTYGCTPITCSASSIKAAQKRYGGEIRITHSVSP